MKYDFQCHIKIKSHVMERLHGFYSFRFSNLITIYNLDLRSYGQHLSLSLINLQINNTKKEIGLIIV